MPSFFTIIYIKTNRLSDEKIAVGILANINELPEFHFSEYKLSFALKPLNQSLSRSIKKSLQLLANDVNQYVNGETSIPMFDEPYAKKLLKKLTQKKRGLLLFGDLIELERPISYKTLFEKYISKDFRPKKTYSTEKNSFKKRFNQYIAHKRFDSFSRKTWVSDEHFPLLSVPVQVDLIRQKNGFTVFKAVDFNLTQNTIQQHIATFRMLIEGLSQYSSENGLSKGRYYLVYESTSSAEKNDLIAKVKSVYKGFELIQMSEMIDKI